MMKSLALKKKNSIRSSTKRESKENSNFLTVSKASSLMPSLMIAKVKSQPKKPTKKFSSKTHRPGSSRKSKQTFDEMVKT